ncbi:hypothetical protein BJV82DRAFT_612198 [Fennellomyces sp. T-0311]|nr:hypothetical protein BJV82DRAFT_612198 [Fennellomyces sp. T-0311]
MTSVQLATEKTDIRRNRLLRPMQSQPNLRTTTSTQLTHAYSNNQKPKEMSRTQHKLLLQRQSFLADDKDYLEHPTNMKRLTKELDRVNREYRCVRHFEHPLAQSLRRVVANNEPAPRLYRRSSAQELLLQQQQSTGLLGRIFGQPQTPPHVKRHSPPC